jgi:hypothetical protein
MPHYFTIEEAKSTLRTIRPLMEEVQAIRDKILKQQPKSWPLVEKAAGNGGSRKASRLVIDFERLDRLVHRIQDTGAILKDLNLGLVDFPAWRADHEVYLCWQYGEAELAFWHEIDAGYSGRQPIETF